jgi:hypothetical protein
VIEISVYEDDDDDDEGIDLLHPKKELVRYLLNCACDCLPLVPEDDDFRPTLLECCEIATQYVFTKKRIDREKLETVWRRLQNCVHFDEDDDEGMGVIHTIRAFENVASQILSGRDSWDESVPLSAVQAHYRASSNDDDVYTAKYKEYKAYLLSLLRSTTLKKSRLTVRGRLADKATLSALLDNLSELGEDLVEVGKDTVRLNYPIDFPIEADTVDLLVEKIWDYKPAIHYLEKLYSLKD